MSEEPKIGDRHVVIRHAGLDLRQYSGPYLVEEWDGTTWREVGWAATQDELREMGCAPPNIDSTPGYARRQRSD